MFTDTRYVYRSAYVISPFRRQRTTTIRLLDRPDTWSSHTELSQDTLLSGMGIMCEEFTQIFMNLILTSLFVGDGFRPRAFTRFLPTIVVNKRWAMWHINVYQYLETIHNVLSHTRRHFKKLA